MDIVLQFIPILIVVALVAVYSFFARRRAKVKAEEERQRGEFPAWSYVTPLGSILYIIGVLMVVLGFSLANAIGDAVVRAGAAGFVAMAPAFSLIVTGIVVIGLGRIVEVLERISASTQHTASASERIGSRSQAPRGGATQAP